jgi:hypothetical protein
MKTCPECGSTVGHCPECGKEYPHGTAAACSEPACAAVNAPIDCECGFGVSADLDGVLDYDMNLKPWEVRS